MGNETVGKIKIPTYTKTCPKHRRPDENGCGADAELKPNKHGVECCYTHKYLKAQQARNGKAQAQAQLQKSRNNLIRHTSTVITTTGTRAVHGNGHTQLQNNPSNPNDHTSAGHGNGHTQLQNIPSNLNKNTSAVITKTGTKVGHGNGHTQLQNNPSNPNDHTSDGHGNGHTQLQNIPTNLNENTSAVIKKKGTKVGHGNGNGHTQLQNIKRKLNENTSAVITKKGTKAYEYSDWEMKRVKKSNVKWDGKESIWRVMQALEDEWKKYKSNSVQEKRSTSHFDTSINEEYNEYLDHVWRVYMEEFSIPSWYSYGREMHGIELDLRRVKFLSNLKHILLEHTAWTGRKSFSDFVTDQEKEMPEEAHLHGYFRPDILWEDVTVPAFPYLHTLGGPAPSYTRQGTSDRR
jgi:hypothetical protein